MKGGHIDRLANCSSCGQLFVKVQLPICPKCIEKRERDFERCRDYLRDNPKTNLTGLSKATGVSVQQIIRFIIEGRLIITTANPNLFYHCDRCGSPIRAGRLCQGCQQQLDSEVGKLVQKKEKKSVQAPDTRHSYRILDREN